jgi:hypothetical protein
MLKVLKYIIIFLLGYKIIKEIFGTKKQKEVPKETPQRNNNQTQKNTNNHIFDDAEDIDYEELK